MPIAAASPISVSKWDVTACGGAAGLAEGGLGEGGAAGLAEGGLAEGAALGLAFAPALAFAFGTGSASDLSLVYVYT